MSILLHRPCRRWGNARLRKVPKDTKAGQFKNAGLPDMLGRKNSRTGADSSDFAHAFTMMAQIAARRTEDSSQVIDSEGSSGAQIDTPPRRELVPGMTNRPQGQRAESGMPIFSKGGIETASSPARAEIINHFPLTRANASRDRAPGSMNQICDTPSRA